MFDPDIDRSLPGDPAVDRIWFVRATDWVAPRRFALLVLLLGGLILTGAIRQTILAYSRAPIYTSTETDETVYSPSGTAQSSSGSEIGSYPSPQFLSVLTIIGAALTALGVLWTMRRFSLRWLLIAAFFTGIAGAIPAQVPPALGGFGSLTVLFTQPVSPNFVANLHQQLTPEAALATLPAAFRAKLSSRPNAGITRLEVSAWDGKTTTKMVPPPVGGITVSMTLRDGLSYEERKSLFDFYEFYTRYLALRAAEAQGISKSQKAIELTAARTFEPFRKEWLEQLPAH